MIAVIIEFFNRRSINTVLKETSYFFEGMGNVMNIVALLVSAQVFVQGLTSIGIIEIIQKTMENINSAGILLLL